GTSHSFGRLGLGALSPATAARTRSSECVEEVARLGTPDGAPGSPRSSSSPPREDMASPISPSSRNAWLAGISFISAPFSTQSNLHSHRSVKLICLLPVHIHRDCGAISLAEDRV
ncbi:unnamed protein product, partial [Prorocentrum cordatum]